MPRLFIAIDLPEEVKQKLGNLRKELAFPQAKWVKKENLHLTLKFLGQVEEEKIHLVSSGLKKALKDFSCFALQTSELGAFPDPKRARVLWIDLEKGREETRNLFRLMDNQLLDLGFEKETREFEPHITLARFKKPAPLLNLPSVGFSCYFIAREVVLFESILKPEGPVYKPREVFVLKKPTKET